MMGVSKTQHGLTVLLCLILMFVQLSLVSTVDDTGSDQAESSTTADTDDTTTSLPTSTTTTTTTSTPPPTTIAPTTSTEPNPSTSTIDVTSTTPVQSTTPDTTTSSEAATTGQSTSAELTSSTIAPTPTTPPTTTTTTSSSSSGSTTPPASSGVTSLASSPGTSSTDADSHSSADPAGSGTIVVSSTGLSPESSASPEGSGSATSTPESSDSVLTSSPPSVTVTSTPTATVTTTTTTTAATTTTTAKPAYPTKKPEKPFRLDFKVGHSNASAVYCTDNCTFDTIVGDVRTAFSSVPGYLYVERGDGAANRRRRDTRFSVAVLFNPGVMVSLTAENRTAAVYVAFQDLGSNSLSVQVQLDQVNATIVAVFVENTADVCKVPNTCPLGYRCGQEVCYHLCENYDCGSNGVCRAVVDTHGSSSATCVCNSGYDYTYSGAHCENKETSDAKKAAIVAGVLGTFCAIFLILILFLYFRMRQSDGGSKRNYQLGGYSNNGYADQEFAMRNPASDDP